MKKTLITFCIITFLLALTGCFSGNKDEKSFVPESPEIKLPVNDDKQPNI